MTTFGQFDCQPKNLIAKTYTRKQWQICLINSPTLISCLHSDVTIGCIVHMWAWEKSRTRLMLHHGSLDVYYRPVRHLNIIEWRLVAELLLVMLCRTILILIPRFTPEMYKEEEYNEEISL